MGGGGCSGIINPYRNFTYAPPSLPSSPGLRHSYSFNFKLLTSYKGFVAFHQWAWQAQKSPPLIL